MKSFREKCREAGVNYRNACRYKQKHPELTDEQVIEYYTNRLVTWCFNSEESFLEKCRKANINIINACRYRQRHKELTDEQVIEYYTNREKSFRRKCLEAGINYGNAISHRSKHPELTDEQVIEYYTNREESFREKCKNAGINYGTAISYKEIHPDLTDEQVIKYYTNREKSFKEKCKNAGINYGTAFQYRSKHPELTDEQVIEYYTNREKSFRRKCLEAGINYGTVIIYRREHPDLTDEQVIEYYTYKKQEVYSDDTLNFISTIEIKDESDRELGRICSEHNLNLGNAFTIKYNLKKSNEEAVKLVYELEGLLDEASNIMLEREDLRYVLSTDNIVKYVINNPNIDRSSVINTICKNKNSEIELKGLSDIELKGLSDLTGVKYEQAKKFASKFNITNENEVIYLMLISDTLNILDTVYTDDNGNNYYSCKCQKCNFENILTYKEIEQHKCL